MAKCGASSIKFKDRFRLKPLYDLHLGSKATDYAELKKDIKYILDTPDCYTFLGGDVIDGILRVDIKRFMSGCQMDEIQDALDDALNLYTRDAIRMLKPLADKGKILFAIDGNHEISIKKHHSYNILGEVCNRIEVPHMGAQCMYRLTLKKSNTGSKFNWVIFAHHGAGGGGQTLGASINKLDNLTKQYYADGYFLGHDHRDMAVKLPRIRMTSWGKPRYLSETYALIRGGTYLKTFIEDGVTYSEEKMYRPTNIGGPTLEFDIVNADRNNKRLDLRVVI
jgi:hypothetical protein